MLDILEIFLTHYNGDSFLISYKHKKNKFAVVFFMYFIISLIPLIAIESSDFLAIDMLVRSCYRNKKSCNKALLKINNYQKNAALSKKFSCQTRLLGLEANLIMATNSNFKRKEAKNIVDAIKKYC